MKKEEFKFSATDMLAIQKGEDSYLFDRGELLYRNGHKENALNYYNVAATFGNIDALNALGGHYLCGIPEKINISLAKAYFAIASNKGDISATYMLGYIYNSDIETKNIERAIYYYKKAVHLIIKEISEDAVLDSEKLTEYPYLCSAFAKVILNGVGIKKDIGLSYLFAKRAYDGYKISKSNDFGLIKATEDFMNLKDFDEIRKKYDYKYKNRFFEYGDEEEYEAESQKIDGSDSIDFDDLDLDDDVPF